MEVLVYNKGCVREDIATQKLRRKIVESGHMTITQLMLSSI